MQSVPSSGLGSGGGEQKRMRHMIHSSDYIVPSFNNYPPFRSLTALQTECFQGYGEAVWNVIVKGVEEADGELPLHKQSLCACASRRLLENFEAEYFRSQQYEVNEGHCKVAKEVFVRASEECNRARDNYWASEFITSGGRIGYDPELLARITTLYIKRQSCYERCGQVHRPLQDHMERSMDCQVAP